MYSDSKSKNGDCIVIPRRFSWFCEKKFGIKLDVRNYGMPDTMGMGESELERVHRKTKKKGSFHEIDILNRDLAIDWTGTQFGDEFRGRPTGMPAIYKLTDGEREELFSTFRGKKN